MGSKPENYARHVISVLVAPDNISKCDPEEDFHEIFDCLSLDAPLTYLVDCLATKLGTIELSSGGAERIIEDLNNRVQKTIETLKIAWQQNKGLPKSFCENNLILNVTSLLIRKYASILSISTGGVNNNINSAAIDAGADDLLADDPVRSLALLFHTFQSGLLTDVELNQFLVGQTKEVVDSGKDLMESLMSDNVMGTSSIDMHALTAKSFGVDLAALLTLSSTLMQCTEADSSNVNLFDSNDLVNRTLCWNTELDAQFGADISDMDFIGVMNAVNLKDVLFILLRGIVIHNDHAIRLNKVEYLIEHFESIFDSILSQRVIRLLDFALYVTYAACEFDVFGRVSESTAERLQQFRVEFEYSDLVDVYTQIDSIRTMFIHFMESIAKGDGPKRYYDSCVLAEVVSYMKEHPSSQVFSYFIPAFATQAMKGITFGSTSSTSE